MPIAGLRPLCANIFVRRRGYVARGCLAAAARNAGLDLDQRVRATTAYKRQMHIPVSQEYCRQIRTAESRGDKELAT